MLQRLAIVIATLAVPSFAVAETSWHAGLDLRADLDTHPIRAGGGIQFGRVDTMLVLDPMFWTDDQVDLDALAFWSPCAKGWGVLGGWRTSTIGLLGGTQYQEKLVVGVGAPLPRFWWLPSMRIRWSFEVATVIAKHGADLPTDWISFASGRDFIDLVNFGMFVTFEYGRAI